MKPKKDIRIFWIYTFFLNAVVIYLLSFLFPAFIVLGNSNLSGIFAVLISSLVLTLILSLVPQATKVFKKGKISDQVLAVIYGILNIITLWILARGASIIGFGISSYWTAVVLGLVLNICQFALWKWQFEK